MKITLESTQAAMEELYAEQGQPILAVALNDPLTSLDQTQIRAIEWVLVAGTDDLTLDSLANGNIIFRRFLCTTPLFISSLMFLVAGNLNSVKALAERVPCTHLIRPDELHSDDGMDTALGQHALEYAQHSNLWQLFASFDRWEQIALQYMTAHTTRRDRLAEKQFKNETKSALNDFITRAKAMVLSDEGLNSVLDEIVKHEDPEAYATLARIRDLYVPEIVLRMHEVFMWGGENIDAWYCTLFQRELTLVIWMMRLIWLLRWRIQGQGCMIRSERQINWKITWERLRIWVFCLWHRIIWAQASGQD